MLKANYKNSVKYLISSQIPFWGRKLIFQHLELHWSFQLFWLSEISQENTFETEGRKELLVIQKG